jgi:L-asparaginase
MCQRPRIAVGGLGGTITMQPDSRASGVVPRLSADDLIATVPGLGDRALVSARTLESLPGASLTEDHLLRALAWAHSRVDDGDDGVVLVQGTDTLEESAYLLDLWWSRPEPLVVTGAMRPPAAAGADGPANLLAAVACAGSPGARDRGVLVVINDSVHTAARVAKRHSMAMGAFESPGVGPIGWIVEGDPHFVAAPTRWDPLPLPPTASTTTPRVALLTSHLDDDGRLLRLVAQGGYDGVVLAALGVGHVSTAAADAVGEVALRLPVLVATRTGAGPTARSWCPHGGLALAAQGPPPPLGAAAPRL